MEATNAITGKEEEAISYTKDGFVFLVDDNPVFLTVLENEVRDIFPFAKVKCFATGEEALSDMRSAHPFLVFLDYDLAGTSTKLMNGISVLKKIKKEAPDTEVVMLSGVDSIRVVTNSMKNGAFDYILKGENVLRNIHYDVANILRRLRVKEEKKEYHLVKVFLKWFFFIIVILFIIAFYNYFKGN